MATDQNRSDELRVRVECVSRSDIGRVRSRNEDVAEVDALRRWAILSDGMGGYRGGDVAARITVDTVRDKLAQAYRPGWSSDTMKETLIGAAREANREVFRVSQTTPGLVGMGSTLVAVVFFEGSLVVAHVGDSRLYRKRDGVLEQLTRDHTVLQEQLDDGMISIDDSRAASIKGLLTRGIGVSYALTPDLGVHEVLAGDVFLLCSDGLTDMLEDDEIAALIEDDQRIEDIADRLVATANLHGGRDNVSVVVARLVV